MEKLVQWDESEGKLIVVTDIEFAIALCQCHDFGFPVWDSATSCWLPRAYHCNFERPTLSSIVRWVVHGLICLADAFGFQNLIVSGLSKEAQGIFKPSRGLYMRMPPDVFKQMIGQLGLMVARRPFRKACDLARPLA